MRFLKKVTVSALGGTGTIVDSLVSGSDEVTNAPSIRAVKEKLGGGNLLFNSDFMCQDNGVGDIEGWTADKFTYINNVGMQATPGKTPSLISPAVMPSWVSSEKAWTFPITLSLSFAYQGSGYSDYITLSATINGYTGNEFIKDLIDLGGGVMLRAQFINDTKYFRLKITTTANIPDAAGAICIGRIKLERGSTATPFTPSMYDCAVVNTMREINAAMVAGLKVFEFSGTLPSSTSGYVDLQIDSGYNAAVLAAYAYNSTDNEYCEMAKPDVVGAAYYRPTIFTHGRTARIYMDATSVTNYASQAYKVYLIGWKNT